jgi:hypothetical protein
MIEHLEQSPGLRPGALFLRQLGDNKKVSQKLDFMGKMWYNMGDNSGKRIF